MSLLVSAVSKSKEAEQKFRVSSPSSPASSAISLEERLNDYALEVLKGICEDRDKRLEGFSKDKTLLDGGIYYAHEYYGVLKAAGANKRLSFLQEKGYFYHGFVPKSHFSYIKDPKSYTGISKNEFLLKDNKTSPSDALEAILSKDTFKVLDCGLVIQVAQYAAILKELGKEKFDAIANAASPAPFILSERQSEVIPKVPLLFLLMDTKKGPVVLKKGLRVYFDGPRSYGVKHWFGSSTGENVLVTDSTKGKERFVGFSFPSRGVSKKEIAIHLLAAYNKKPNYDHISRNILEKSYASLGDRREEIMNYMNMHVEDQLTMKQMLVEEQGGKMRNVSFELSGHRIAKLKAASIPEALTLLTQWSLAYTSSK